MIKNGICKSHGSNVNERALLQTHVISKLNRKELEDRYYAILDINLGLKGKLNCMIEKYKLLNTKYIRLDEQRKLNGKSENICNKILEETIENHLLRICTLEKINERLLEKINAIKIKTFAQKQYYTTNNRNNIKINVVEPECDENKETERCNEFVEDKISILEKEIENLKNENEGLKKYLCDNRIEMQSRNINKENHDTNEFLSSSDIDKSISKNFREATIQTEEEFQIDLLNQKLTEEQIKVFELENSAKYSKLSENVLKEFNNRLETLRMKCLTDNTVVVKKNDLEIKNRDLQNQLNDLRVERELLKTINKDLMSKILSMQSEIDMLQLSMNAKNKLQNIEHKTVSDIHKLKETFNDTNEDNIVVDKLDEKINVPKDDSLFINNNIDLYNENISMNVSSEQNLEPILSDDDLKIDIVENVAVVSEKKTEQSIEQVINDTNEICNVSTPSLINEDDDKHQTDEKSFDDATYDISINDESCKVNNSLLSSFDEYLSEGEIQKSILRKINNALQLNIEKSLKSDNVDPIERMDISERTELSLQTLSIEMEKCKALMNNKYMKKIPKTNKNNINAESAQFILHIISAELSKDASDELKESSYFLTWQFYKNAIAYTPLKNNESFDVNYCSTCDLIMNQSLKDYFTNESISIDIYKRDVDTSLIFASCSLVLEDILINANRKNTLSLKLLKTSDSSECGTLKVCCQLNYDTIL